MDARSLLSVGLAAVAFSLLNIGLVLEKKAAAAIPPIEHGRLSESAKRFLTSPTWLLGFLLTNVQVLPMWVALGLGSMSLVMPMAGVGLVVLAGFARVYLHEPISRLMAVGMALVTVGVVAFGASHPEVRLPSRDESLFLASQPSGLAFVVLLAALAVVPIVASVRTSWRAADVAFGIGSGVAASVATIASRLMMAGLGVSGAEGTVGAILGRTATWPLLAVVVLANLSAMAMQQFGFQKGRAVIVVTVYTVATVLLPVLAGVLVFAEWDRVSGVVLMSQVLGMGLVVAGTVLLSSSGAARAWAPGVASRPAAKPSP